MSIKQRQLELGLIEAKKTLGAEFYFCVAFFLKTSLHIFFALFCAFGADEVKEMHKKHNEQQQTYVSVVYVSVRACMLHTSQSASSSSFSS